MRGSSPGLDLSSGVYGRGVEEGFFVPLRGLAAGLSYAVLCSDVGKLFTF